MFICSLQRNLNCKLYLSLSVCFPFSFYPPLVLWANNAQDAGRSVLIG